MLAPRAPDRRDEVRHRAARLELLPARRQIEPACLPDRSLEVGFRDHVLGAYFLGTQLARPDPAPDRLRVAPGASRCFGHRKHVVGYYYWLRVRLRVPTAESLIYLIASGPVPRMTATEAARSFSDVLNRVAAGEEFEVTRSGAPVAVIGPPTGRLVSAERFRELMASAPRPDADFADDVRRLRETVDPPVTPWPS